ncbi:MAG: M20/M25/M40 family metallo-hydrolase, partial [Rhizobiales bacterium]|nr:M20/M25/M40 family metallo-hydrolase [Hyphomicrobiales bacterium]
MVDVKNQQIQVFDWLDKMQNTMFTKTVDWCDINTGSANLDGLLDFSKKLQGEFLCLGNIELIDLPDRVVIDDDGSEATYKSAPIIRFNKPQKGKPSILLVAHYDTVYAKDHAFQKCKMMPDGTLNGPGVADLKGGMVVMLYALQALKMSGLMAQVGIEVLLNPDEEIGSPVSGAYL